MIAVHVVNNEGSFNSPFNAFYMFETRLLVNVIFLLFMYHSNPYKFNCLGIASKEAFLKISFLCSTNLITCKKKDFPVV
jgi:hypothetical protein